MVSPAPDQQDRHNYGIVVRLSLVVLAALLSALLFGSHSQVVRAHPNVVVDNNCTLIVPPNPLSAAGLATPYQLTNTDPGQVCNEANANQSAFVQAVIFDPATNSFSVYEPLVIDMGTTPAVAPLLPAVPPNAVVALWFGFNATNLTLADSVPGTLAGANCVNGLGAGANLSVFMQFAYCNAPAFFAAVNAAITQGKVKVPPLGVANDGQACPTVRDFFVVDQDQSDNVQTTYLALPSGQTAQNSAVNRALLPGATQIGNPSDNALVSKILDPVLGCAPWLAPDLANPGSMTPALPLDELQALVNQGTPMAQVPAGDPMVLVNGALSLAKTNLYRAGVDQVQAGSLDQADTARYCREMLRIQPNRLLLDQAKLSIASPAPAVGSTLFNFLVARFSGSWALLNCAALTGLADPSQLTIDGMGVAIGAGFNMQLLATELTSIQPLQQADYAADLAPKDGGLGAINPAAPAAAPPAGPSIYLLNIPVTGCGSTTPQNYPVLALQNVSVTAVPCPGSRFIGWTGGPCDKTTINPCSIPAGTQVTANFAP